MHTIKLSRRRQTIYNMLAIAVIAALLAVGGDFLAGATSEVAAQEPKPDPKASWGECVGEQPSLNYNKLTGMIGFAANEAGRPIYAGMESWQAASPEEAARGYFTQCGILFGLQDQASELKLSRQTAEGAARSIVRFQQVYQGIPVLAGELVIQLTPQNDILLVNGETLPGIGVDTQPVITASEAGTTAMAAVGNAEKTDAAALQATAPELWIYNPALITDQPGDTSLAWRMEVTSRDLAPIRYLVLVDAADGTVLLNINQIDTARNRKTYTAHNGVGLPGTLVCNEANTNCTGGDAHAVAAHKGARDTYDFYRNYHGRDSINNAGMALISTVHFASGFCNAFWNGSQMVYGDGCFLIADDVVAHEMTHGVTDFESNLVYSYQSGAINESFSDIWGEFVDQTNGRGNDSAGVRWYMGEDTSIGTIRNLKNPTEFEDPDRMGSPYYYTGPADNGGVHKNSGVGNKAAYLITDGDTFNGYTILGLGLTKAAKIYYEAQRNILTSGSNYSDLGNALVQACINLIGTSGITWTNCDQVQYATLATEMSYAPPPYNDDFGSTQDFYGLPYTNAPLDISAATQAGDDPGFACLGNSNRHQTVWYSYTPGQNGNLRVDTRWSTYDTVLAAYTGTRGSLTSVACNDDTNGLQSQITFYATAGVTYYFQIASYTSDVNGLLKLHAKYWSETDWTSPSNSFRVPRSRTSAAAVGGKLYVIGGESPAFAPLDPSAAPAPDGGPLSSITEGAIEPATWERSVEIYDPGSGLWTFGARKPTGVSNTSAAVINNMIYVPGGWDGGKAVKVLEAYRPSTNTWIKLPSMPAAQLAHAVAAVGTKLYVMGGRNSSGSILNTCRVYDSATRLWSLCAHMNYAREFAAATVLNGKIYVMGGLDGYELAVVEEYNPRTNRWTVKAPMSIARGGPGAASYGGRVFVCGGGFWSYLDSCEQYDPVLNNWSAFDPLNYGRRTLGMAVIGNSLYAVGGWNGYYSMAFERFSLPTASLLSVASEDGWIRESSENSSLGGTVQSASSTLYVGDDARNRQYRSVLSFNTSLPGGATILTVNLKVKKAQVVGANPFSTHGRLVVDVTPGSFSGNAALDLWDFEAPVDPAGRSAAFNMGSRLVGGWYSGNMNPAYFGSINTWGSTQFRLRFMQDDDNDAIADYLSLFSGEYPGNEPVLTIVYYVP